jgi:hypothetical protein
VTPLDILLAYGMPPYREPAPEPPLPDAIRVPTEQHRDGVQLGPVAYMSGGGPLYDCPSGCGLWTSEPAKLCSCCSELKPATHWDGLVGTCGDCAPGQYGE